MGLESKVVTEGVKNLAKGASDTVAKGAKGLMAKRVGRVALGSLAGAGAGGIVGIATGADEDNMKSLVAGGAIAGAIGGTVSTLGMKNDLQLAGEISGPGHVGTGFAPLKNMRVKNTGEMLGDIAIVEERATGQMAMDLGQYDGINTTGIKNTVNEVIGKAKSGVNNLGQELEDIKGRRIINKQAGKINDIDIMEQANGQFTLF